MKRDGKFYVLNACADIARCAEAINRGDTQSYNNNRARAFATLAHCRNINEWSAYEEGLLLIREMVLAHEDGRLTEYLSQLDDTAVELLRTC